jgi:hypothetical protein
MTRALRGDLGAPAGTGGAAPGEPGPWAVSIPAGESRSLAALRGIAGLEVAAGPAPEAPARSPDAPGDDPGVLWLRGPPGPDESLDRLLRRVPGARRFRVGTGGRLTEAGRRLAVSDRLPEAGWTPLASYLVPAEFAGLGLVPPPPAPGPVAVPLRLVPAAGRPLEAAALLCDWPRFARWALGAPGVRLARLAFAVSGAGEVLVVGLPPPPLAGCRLWRAGSILVPCGSAWSPAVDAAVLARALALSPGDLGLLAPSGEIDVIPAAGLVAASRSSVRATLEAMPAPAPET